MLFVSKGVWLIILMISIDLSSTQQPPSSTRPPPIVSTRPRPIVSTRPRPIVSTRPPPVGAPQAVCSQGCGNGECVGPDKCNCNQGWTGSLCQTPVCSQGCGNGECVGYDKCNCNQGWTGSLCQTLGDPPLCSFVLLAECEIPEVSARCPNHCTAVLGCSTAQLAQGFFHLPGSEQCLRVFNDDYLNWDEAHRKCQFEGLALATIEDYQAVDIRKYLVNTIGVDYFTWVGGRTMDATWTWIRSGVALAQNSPLFWPDEGSDVSNDSCLRMGTSPGSCLALLTYKGHMMKHPDRPYTPGGCSGRLWYTLCEVPVISR